MLRRASRRADRVTEELLAAFPHADENFLLRVRESYLENLRIAIRLAKPKRKRR